VFDVNHRGFFQILLLKQLSHLGSTGYGTEYRNMLYKNWGVVDRNDMINGAKFLVKAGKVDPKKICITGQSAGGFLVLGVMRSLEKLFAAGVSFYGVAELEGLVKVLINT
jgi:dipeptidyl aminopeptidase/acylaminoacyl peptidase